MGDLGIHSPSAHTQPGTAKRRSSPVVAGARGLSGDRYSPNLAKWCAKNGRGPGSEVFRHEDGALYIGWLDEGQHLIGSRLWQVLTSGSRAEAYCWTGMGGKLALLPTFWDDYARIGRCAIDTDHSRAFIGEDTRWAVDGERRSCRWCGEHTQTLRRWTEPVERERWESTIPAQPERGGDEAEGVVKPKAPDAAEVVVPDHAPLEVPDIGNYYGGLWIKREGGVDYWSIEDYSGHYWEVVPEPVASAIRAMISTAEQEGRA